MTDRRYVVAFIAALAIAILATAGVYRFLDGAVSAEPADALRPVLVAARDVPAGTTLDSASVAVMRWPVRSVPSHAYVSADSVVGRVLRTGVVRGEPVLVGHLAALGANEGLAAVIQPGRRAMSVRVTEAAGFSGVARSDARVDVLVTMRADDAGIASVAKVVMSDVRVLAVGVHADSMGMHTIVGAPIVTLEVTPSEAEQLAVAESQGTIQLVLRGFGTTDRPETPGASTRDVIGRAPARALAEAHGPAGAPALAPGSAPRPFFAPNGTAGRSAAVAPRVPIVTAALPAAAAAAPAEAPRDEEPVVRIFRGNQVEQQRVSVEQPRVSVGRQP